MIIRSLVCLLFLVSSVVLVTGQTTDTKKAVPPCPISSIEKLRDIPFPAGINLQFLIKELARDIDLNVLFDADSRLEARSVKIELKNVTIPAALEYIRVQEGLVFEEVGTKTILVTSRYRETSVPQIGVGVAPLPAQIAQYFGVEGGILINYVRPDSPAWNAKLQAGDVIVEVDGVPVRGALGAIQTINDKNEGDVTLKFVRDHKNHTVGVTPEKGIRYQ